MRGYIDNPRAAMAKEFRNLGHITAFAVFIAVVCVFIPETRIASVPKKCDRVNGTYDCGKSSMLDSLRNGIDAEQLLKCIDPSGRGDHTNTNQKISDLESALFNCSQDCMDDTCDQPQCNTDISGVMAKNPLHAFNSKQLLDLNVFDQCSAPAYLGGPMDRSRSADDNDVCKFLGVGYMASGANCALLQRHHGLGISAVVLGGVWGLAVLVAYVLYVWSPENTFSKTILGINDGERRYLQLLFHVYSAITIIVMAFYVLSAMDWGMRMNNCHSPVASSPNTGFANGITKTTFVGDGSVTTNAIGSKYTANDTMIPFLQVAGEFVDDTQNDTSFIKWTDLHYTDNPIHGLRDSTNASSTKGLCDGGIGHQLNAKPGSFFKDSTGVSSVALGGYLRAATAFILLPLALSLALQTFVGINDWFNGNFFSTEKTAMPGEGANGMAYWLARLIISLLVAVFFYILGAHWMKEGWNDERCGKESGFDVASLGSSNGNGSYGHKVHAQASAFAMAGLATFTCIESVLQLIGRGAKSENGLQTFLGSYSFKAFSAAVIFATFVFFIIELGAIIGGNASDLCDPYLGHGEQKAVTAGLYIIFGIILIFALMYGFSGGMPRQADAANLSKSMSYFQMKPMAQITQSFL
jgi:hypothetical protein